MTPNTEKLNSLKFDDGTFQAYAFPGGYPIFYIVEDNAVLCPKCVNENLGDDSFTPADSDVNYEDQSLYCDHCSKPIESAYGDN